MLEAIRKRTGGIVVKAFLGILILSFAVWGIGDTVRSLSTETEVASVGGVSIPPERLSNEMQREMNRLRNVFKDQQFDMEQARALGVDKQVLGGLIDNTLFSLGAEDMDVAISNTVITDEIKRNPEFNGPLGKFDRYTFQQILFSNGFTEAGFIERVRANLKRAQYLESLVAGGNSPAIMAEITYRHRNEKRVAESILFADDAMTAIGDPSDDDIVKFYQDNTARFTAPEYRALTFITMAADELAKEIAVSEDEIKAAYEARQDEFITAERRKLQQILVDDEETAKRAHQMLSEGKDFAEVAKEVADLDADAIELGTFEREGILSELANAVFQIPNGGFSTPLETPLGWHVMRVNGIERGEQRALEDVRGELSKEVAKEKAIDSLFQLSNQLDDELGGGATLEEAAERMNLKLLKADAVDSTGKDAAGKAVKDLPAGNFVKIAFETPENTDSQVTEAGADGYFVLRVDKVTPPAVKPLDAIKDEAAKALKTERRAEATKKAAEDALKQLGEGKDMADIAKELGIEVKTTEPFTRAPKIPVSGLPGNLVTSIFAVKPGEAVTGRGPKGHVLARLKEIKEADPKDDKEGVDKARLELTRSIQTSLVKQLANALRARYPVTVNSRAVDQLF